MTNGVDHNQGGGKNSEKPSGEPKSGAKPVPAATPHPDQAETKQAK